METVLTATIDPWGYGKRSYITNDLKFTLNENRVNCNIWQCPSNTIKTIVPVQYIIFHVNIPQNLFPRQNMIVTIQNDNVFKKNNGENLHITNVKIVSNKIQFKLSNIVDVNTVLYWDTINLHWNI